MIAQSISWHDLCIFYKQKRITEKVYEEYPAMINSPGLVISGK